MSTKVAESWETTIYNRLYKTMQRARCTCSMIFFAIVGASVVGDIGIGAWWTSPASYLNSHSVEM